MGKIFQIVLFAALITLKTAAQDTTIMGKVVDTGGLPLAGATIMEKGTKNAVSADNSGSFKISVAARSVLLVSAIGYVTQEVQGDKSTIVMANDNQALREVVVTAFGISREKKGLGYTTQSVKGEALVQAANTGLAGALQGKVAGVQITPSSGMPGASSLVTIRGARSFTGNNAPLYVIDGMPVSSNADLSTNNSVTGTDYANRAVDIDPNDIANIEILKGQAASALYGIRASNGVIVITTKSGRGAKGKAQITYNSTVSFDQLSRKPAVQTTYAQGANGNYNPNASTSYGPKISDLPKSTTHGGETVNQYTTASGMHPGKYYVPQRALAGLDPWVSPGVYDNIGGFFNTGTIYNNSISVVNGTDNGSFALSLGSTNQKGIVHNTGLDKFNARFAAESKISDHFKGSFNGNFINSVINKAPSANDGIIATVYPAPASYDLKGIPNHYLGNVYRPVGYRGGAFVNPYWGQEHNTFEEKTNRFFGNTSIAYSTKLSHQTSLDVKYQVGVDAYTTSFQDVWSFGSPTRGSNNNGDISEYSYTNTTLNSLLTASLRWDVNGSFKLNALFGNEVVNAVTKYIYSYGSDFSFPGFNHMDNTGVKNATENSSKQRTIGTFGNLSLSYLQILYLGISGRRDVVSQMPSNNRSFFYPSASLSFVFTEIGALKNDPIFNLGKLRLSFAQVGQAGTYLQNFYAVPAYGGGFFSGTPILYPINGIKAYIPNASVYDPNLKPQNTTSYEIGADLGFFKNLVELNYTYSTQQVKDQIFSVPLPGSTGAASFITNGGKIHTDVHEATLSINPIRRKELEWNIGLNFSKIDNYVDELAPGVESIFLGGFTTPQVRAGIGYKFPVIYGSSYARNDKGQVIVGSDGIPLTGAPKVIGNAAPDFNLGANTRLRFKRLTLSAVTDWKKGGQMYSGTTGLMDNYGASETSAEARDKDAVLFEGAVKEDGKPNDIVISGYNNIQRYFQTLNTIDESSIVNSSYFKLREIALRINLIKKDKLNLSLNLFARNILLWTNSPLLDPESSQGNTNMAGAFERFTLPQTKSFGAGVNVQF
jgi:TonB-linked SusC/RagA family outer membrane protein